MKNSKFLDYIKFMWKNMKEVKRYLPLILLLTIILSIISFFIAIFSKNMIDYVIDVNGKLTIMLPIIIALYILSGFISYGLTLLQTYFYDKFKIKIQKDFYAKLLNTDYIFFTALSSSDIYYRMFTDTSLMISYFIQLLISIPIKILIFIISTVILAYWSPLICGLFFILIAIQFILVLVFKNKIKLNYKRLKAKEEALIQSINENCQRIDVIRSLNLFSYCANEAEEHFTKYFKQDIKSISVSNLHSNLVSLTSQLWNVIILIVGVQLIVSGDMTLGTIMGISMLASFISSSINEFFGAVMNYQSTIVSFNRFEEFYSSKSIAQPNRSLLFNFKDSITLNNVNFAYNSKDVFCELNLILNKNRIYLIKGANGSGKTTFCRIVARFLMPQKGTILIDNTDISFIEEESFRKNVIFVNASPILLNKSIYENIVLESILPNSLVNSIITDCKLEDVVQKHGLHKELGLQNGELSQGEIQKISIARALIRKPQILILDEPTAHIDLNSSKDIINTLISYQIENEALLIICSHDVRLNDITNNTIDLSKLNNQL